MNSIWSGKIELQCVQFFFVLFASWMLENIQHFFISSLQANKMIWLSFFLILISLPIFFVCANLIQNWYPIEKPIIISIHKSQNENNRIDSVSLTQTLAHTRQNIFAMWYWHFNNSTFFLWFFLSYTAHLTAQPQHFAYFQPTKQPTNKQTNDKQTLPTVFFLRE